MGAPPLDPRWLWALPLSQTSAILPTPDELLQNVLVAHKKVCLCVCFRGGGEDTTFKAKTKDYEKVEAKAKDRVAEDRLPL